MSKDNKQYIRENLTKSDVSKELKVYMNTQEFKTKIEKIVEEKLKNNKELEDKVVEISRNVITQLFKTLWVKRGVWQSSLSNKSS